MRVSVQFLPCKNLLLLYPRRVANDALWFQRTADSDYIYSCGSKDEADECFD